VRGHTSLSAALVACVVAIAVPALAVSPSPQPDGDLSAQQRLADRHHPRHSSDNQPGPLAPKIPAFGRGTTTTSHVVERDVAPGVAFTRWDQTDRRGAIRAYLLTIDPEEPGVRIDYASMRRVRATAPVTDILARDSAMAGVNADFYDIGDTGAPLGLGQDRQRGLLHARRSGHNAAFYVDRAGAPQIGPVRLEARISSHPGLVINRPSDGSQRPVANALAVGYTTPE
jgi:hypothetical protein